MHTRARMVAAKFAHNSIIVSVECIFGWCACVCTAQNPFNRGSIFIKFRLTITHNSVAIVLRGNHSLILSLLQSMQNPTVTFGLPWLRSNAINFPHVWTRSASILGSLTFNQFAPGRYATRITRLHIPLLAPATRVRSTHVSGLVFSSHATFLHITFYLLSLSRSLFFVFPHVFPMIWFVE